MDNDCAYFFIMDFFREKRLFCIKKIFLSFFYKKCLKKGTDSSFFLVQIILEIV